MKSFPLKVVTPDGMLFDGEAEEIVVRTTSGDLGIMAGHMDCVAPLGMGKAMIRTAEGKKYAACIGGLIYVMDGAVRLVPTTFEWSDRIDVDRAKDAADRAQKTISGNGTTDMELRMAEAHLKRALVRISVAQSVK